MIWRLRNRGNLCRYPLVSSEARWRISTHDALFPPGPYVAMEINDNRLAVSQSLLIPVGASPRGRLPLAGGECVPTRAERRGRVSTTKHGTQFSGSVRLNGCGSCPPGTACTKQACSIFCGASAASGGLPTTLPPRRPPPCWGRSCRCGSAHPEVGWGPRRMEPSLWRRGPQVSVTWPTCRPSASESGRKPENVDSRTLKEGRSEGTEAPPPQDVCRDLSSGCWRENKKSGRLFLNVSNDFSSEMRMFAAQRRKILIWCRCVTVLWAVNGEEENLKRS